MLRSVIYRMSKEGMRKTEENARKEGTTRRDIQSIPEKSKWKLKTKMIELFI